MNQGLDVLEQSNEANFLWPPIAEALDTYIKRKDGGAEGYERTSRLIHLWEAISTTLSAAAITCAAFESNPSFFLKCREYSHGRRWDSLTRSFNKSQGIFDGSAIKRVDILWEIGSREHEISFLKALRNFVLSESIKLDQFFLEWGKVCEVSFERKANGLYSVRETLRYINSFRNRFAHVPFPYDCMNKIADSFEEVTRQVFLVEPFPWLKTTKDGVESALTGALRWEGKLLRGTVLLRQDSKIIDGPSFHFPAFSTTEVRIWPAKPFIHIDSMIRPHILSRAEVASGRVEYTRYKAEANAVTHVDVPDWQHHIPVPTEPEYRTKQDLEEKRAESDTFKVHSVGQGNSTVLESGSEAKEITFAEALQLVRNEQFEAAIDFFRQLTTARPGYHIAWLRLGHAEREWAMRQRFSDKDKAVYLFGESIRALGKAQEHKDRERKAQALYELSKTLYQRGKFLKDPKDAQDALEQAKKAFEADSDSAYESWISYMENHQEYSNG